MAEFYAKQELLELAKREDLGNKGQTHRSFGVHVTFVRSLTMDTWKEDQLRRMRLGGNLPFKAFMKAYPPQGGYVPGMSPTELYHTWAATQYREKLNAEVLGVAWAPSSPPPANTIDPPSRPASSQRKSRANKPAASSSPLAREDTSSPTPGTDDARSAKEAYFSGLGQASHSTDLLNLCCIYIWANSQGGRYEGFGSTPTPESHPSYGLSSANAPTLSDFQSDPMGALGKGWSLFAAAAAGAGKAVNENIIQPGMEKAMDPTLRATATTYVNQATKKAAEAASGANDWGRSTFGIDVAGKARQTFLGPGPRGEYSSLANHPENDWNNGPHSDDGDDDFFDRETREAETKWASKQAEMKKPATKPAVHDDDDDEWKDF
ncbi:Zn finger-containing GTPase- Activating Protein for ARF [Tulasnella sp. 403]|nr:Zn finger-containing GTPase- Activating Protein for ARF [Tulasnella sp. 403]